MNTSLQKTFVRSSRTMVVPLAAAGSVNSIAHIPQLGTVFYIVSANVAGEIIIKTDRTQEESFTAGTGKRFEDEFYYSTLEISNPNPFPITVVLFCGFGNYIDNRLNLASQSVYLPVTDPPSNLIGKNVTTINAGASVVMDGVPAADQYRRAAVLVDNLDAASPLTVYDSVGGVAGFVLPLSSRYIPASGYVKIANDTGAAINCAVAEIWNLTP